MEIDVYKTVISLLESGMTQAEIAKETKTYQSCISDIKNRKSGLTRPSHNFVSKLSALAKKRLKQSKKRVRN